MKITFIEHACVMIEYNQKVIVVDPFCSDVESVVRKFPHFIHPDFVVLTHGHDDHTGALTSVAGKNTVIIGIVELCSHLSRQGFLHTVGMNFGGTVTFDDISFSIVPATHSSSENGVYLGEPAGFVVKLGDQTIYHAGDTDIFGDMALINRFHRPTIGLIPIGGRFTMDVEKAAVCCNEMFSFDTVIPIHYNTFPPIRADEKRFASMVKTKTIILKSGETATF